MRFEKGRKQRRDGTSSMWRRSACAETVSPPPGSLGSWAKAGLTKGAFSPHFESKDALVREALASALSDQQHRLDEDHRRGLDLEGAISEIPEPRSPRRPDGRVPLGGIAPRNRPTAPVHQERLRERAAKLRLQHWPRCFLTQMQERAAVARPPSSASWWAPFSSHGLCPMLRRQSRSWKAALRPPCTWHELHLPRLGSR